LEFSDEEIDNYIVENGIKRIVVDGFKSIIVPNNDIQLAKDFLPFFFDKLSTGELTSMITATITPQNSLQRRIDLMVLQYSASIIRPDGVRNTMTLR
jgi:hypothetical protein